MPDPEAFRYTFDRLSEVTEKFLKAKGFDRFGLFTLEEALPKVGKNLARLLAEISLSALTC